MSKISRTQKKTAQISEQWGVLQKFEDNFVGKETIYDNVIIAMSKMLLKNNKSLNNNTISVTDAESILHVHINNTSMVISQTYLRVNQCNRQCFLCTHTQNNLHLLQVHQMKRL